MELVKIVIPWGNRAVFKPLFGEVFYIYIKREGGQERYFRMKRANI